MENTNTKVLLIEDEEAHSEFLLRVFESDDLFEVKTADNLKTARELIDQYKPDLIIADMFLPDGKSTELLTGEKMPIIMVTSQGDEQMAVEAIKGGALDYVVKSQNTLSEMPRVARRALREWGHIAQRVKAENELSQSREMYRALAENTVDAIVRFDTDMRHVYANPAYEAILAKSSEEIVGKTLEELGLPTEVSTSCSNGMTRVFRTGKSFDMEVTFKKNGDVTTLDYRLVPEFSSSGEVLTVLATIRNVTETRRLQEYVGRAERLETAGSIAGQVAHDFNNLLGPLVAYPGFIKEELPQGHPSVPFLDGIERAAEQMADINQQLLTLGRRGHYNQEVIDLNQVIKQVVQSLTPVPQTLVVKTELADNLMQIRGGPSQISRMIANLISNGRDAMQNIGWLTITTENFYADDFSGSFGQIPRGEYVKLTVSDTGCGIPESVMPEIFDPFFTTKRANQRRGSGLGLSVVHAVIKDHSGYVDVDSRIGEGTHFQAFFPITRDPMETSDTETVPRGSETVLVVDDDAIQREVTVRLLDKLGYVPATADCGETALEMVQEQPYDLLVLDMVMPCGMDGTDTYRKILEIYPEQRALIVSGFAESKRVETALSLGATAFLRKPLTLQTLAKAVRTALAPAAN